MNYLKNLAVFSLALTCALSPSSWARWESPESVPVKYNFRKTKIHVREDGSFKVTNEFQAEILNDAGKRGAGISRFIYDPHVMKLRVLEARTINKKSISEVRPQNIEDKPLSSSAANGLDSRNQVTVVFSNVEVGSKIFLKTETDYYVSQIPGHFDRLTSLGYDEYLEHFEMDVDSELPLYHEINDPHRVLSEAGTEHSYHVELKAPIFNSVIDETNSLVDSRSLTWVGLTSAKTLADFPRMLSLRFDEITSASLPPIFAEVLAKAREARSDQDQVNTVLSEISNILRYVSDTRSLDGMIIPRPLEQIAADRYADCKDYSAVIAAILKRLDFKTFGAILKAGAPNEVMLSPLKLPIVEANHIIVYAVKAGREYWLDGTTASADSGRIHLNDSDRPAFILDPQGMYVRQTPALTEHDEIFDREMTLFIKDRQIAADGVLHVEGGKDAPLLGAAQLFASNEFINEAIISRVDADLQSMTNLKVAPYNLKSRIVRPLDFSFHYEKSLHLNLTSMGRGLNLPGPSLVTDKFPISTEDRVSSLYLGSPQVVHKKTILRGRNFLLNEGLACEGQSPWMDYSRQLSKNSDGSVVLDDKVVVHVAKIPTKELKSAQFQNFQTQILDCEGSVTVVIGNDAAAIGPNTP